MFALKRLALGAAIAVLAITGMPASAQAATPDLVSPGGEHSRLQAPAADAVPGIAPPGADKTAVYLDSAGRVIPAVEGPTTDSETALIGCTPVSGRDNPHRSSTGVVVSGHGWWDKGNCSNDRANVQNCLYEWYTDNTWRQKACSPVEELKPGGGSSWRTVARHDCDSTLATSWRNHVDVDVIGEIDTAEKPMNQADVNCRVN
ncbi:hypothetical protein [Sphaerimonospora mesophila]|uniref:hypothetical protein n=1 Tax=Sphaerimonospora mesophila TaxID=37483 RepID=UPI000AF8E68F